MFDAWKKPVPHTDILVPTHPSYKATEVAAVEGKKEGKTSVDLTHYNIPFRGIVATEAKAHGFIVAHGDKEGLKLLRQLEAIAITRYAQPADRWNVEEQKKTLDAIILKTKMTEQKMQELLDATLMKFLKVGQLAMHERQKARDMEAAHHAQQPAFRSTTAKLAEVKPLEGKALERAVKTQQDRDNTPVGLHTAPPAPTAEDIALRKQEQFEKFSKAQRTGIPSYTGLFGHESYAKTFAAKDSFASVAAEAAPRRLSRR